MHATTILFRSIPFNDSNIISWSLCFPCFHVNDVCVYAKYKDFVFVCLNLKISLDMLLVQYAKFITEKAFGCRERNTLVRQKTENENQKVQSTCTCNLCFLVFLFVFTFQAQIHPSTHTPVPNVFLFVFTLHTHLPTHTCTQCFPFSFQPSS